VLTILFIKSQQNTMKKHIILFAIIFSHFSLFGQVKFYISTNGDDSYKGSADRPFASLNAARNAIRDYKKTHTEDVSFIVTIAEGSYYLTEPFILSPEDSGTPAHPIIYKAEKDASPVFSGGKKISGFKIQENGIWKVKIPECSYYNWRFDQLYVNNERAFLARTPNSGFLYIDNIQEYIWEQGTSKVAERAQQKIKFNDEDFTSVKNTSEEEINLMRMKAYHKWDFTVKYIDKTDKDSSTLFTSGRGMKPWNPLTKKGRIVLENYQAALDTTGEWYLGKNGTLYYIPLPGQTPDNTEIIAPALDNLVLFDGSTSNNNFVENIKLEGLTFKHCHYRIPQSGFEPNQAATVLNAAIMLKGAKNITFSTCEISHTGQHALWFGKGCSNSSVKHCYLHNLGGGGIYLGDKHPLKDKEHTHHITLDNNIIQSGGKEFPPAVGIWIGHSSDCTVTHNDIGDFYYTGISIGWTWGYNPSLAKRNIITYNHIHHIGWDLLSDMAAVYTLGESEGTIIRNNVIHHVHAYSYGGWGMYCDEGSSGILLENNLVYSTKTGGFQQHYGKNNRVRNNILAYSKLYQAQCARAEDHRSFDFTNNIIVFNTGVVLKGVWDKADILIDKNLYWNTNDSSYDFVGLSFEEWQNLGHDKNSYIENPDFKDAPGFNFQFKSKKAYQKIGFKPFERSEAGVYGNKDWKKKACLSTSIQEEFDKRVENNLKNDALMKSRL
jgi:hypothetical protein